MRGTLGRRFAPANITVPCSGSGAALFVPSPTSRTARSAMLPVTFVNIGA